MRKVLKKEPITAEQMRKDARALPEFNKPPRRRRSIAEKMSFLWCDGNGKPGKRALFFSLTYLVALGYVVWSMFNPAAFSESVAFFISAILGGTGVGYIHNERGNRMPGMEIIPDSRSFPSPDIQPAKPWLRPKKTRPQATPVPPRAIIGKK